MFFNVDVELDHAVDMYDCALMTENGESAIYDETEQSCIQPMTEYNTEAFQSELSNFVRNTRQNGCMFLAEVGPVDSQQKSMFHVEHSDGSQTRYIPMYDIRDVSVKSSLKCGSKNSRIDAEDDFQNVFAPEMDKNPVGFCALNVGQDVNAVALTDYTKKDPYMYCSQLKYSRDGNDRKTFSDLLLESEKNNMLMYKTLEEWGVSSYGELIQTGIDPISAFEPAGDVRGIDGNYVLDFPMTQIDSEYDTGNVHAGLMHVKSPYNSQYTIEMPNDTQLSNARRYCGIGQSSNQAYLKFYDNVSYGMEESMTKDGIRDLVAHGRETEKLPYQKIETITRNKFSNKAKHKSNLFSIRIEDLDELSENALGDEMLEKQKSNIRDEIYSAIKDIVANVCPVNTQLFKVYFGT